MMLACALAGLLVQANAAAATPATAQQSCAQPTRWDADLQHTGWTRKDGAPAGLYSMAQDADGLLWFAARDGLYSFDGARFVRNDRAARRTRTLPPWRWCSSRCRCRPGC